MPKSRKIKYSFPILKEKEIIKCMKELQIYIERHDLQNPTEERFKNIYAKILHNLIKLEVNQPKFDENLPGFEHPSLHVVSVTHILLIKLGIKFMKRCGVKNFCLKDVLYPDNKRTIRNLSAIINFAKYRHEKVLIFENHQHIERELEKQVKNEHKTNKMYAAQYTSLQKKIEEEKPKINEINDTIKVIYYIYIYKYNILY